MLNQVKEKGRVLGEKSMGCCMAGKGLQWGMGSIHKFEDSLQEEEAF